MVQFEFMINLITTVLVLKELFPSFINVSHAFYFIRNSEDRGTKPVLDPETIDENERKGIFSSGNTNNS